MKTVFYLLILLASVITSCDNTGRDKKEARPTPGGVAPGESTSENIQPDTVSKTTVDTANTRPSKSDAIAEDGAALTGLWLTPHAATVKIEFFADSTFIFDDYNATLQKEEKLTGKYRVTGNTLTLLYHDRPQQKFRFQKGEGNDKNYYITRPGYYFVKGERPKSN